ncbi:CotH kinase family protein [Alteromonadaceae bacterium BrNp21-10]|nr:CotH kinase family protein [Alteromonadaceae bacterium BrNp21-10]
MLLHKNGSTLNTGLLLLVIFILGGCGGASTSDTPPTTKVPSVTTPEPVISEPEEPIAVTQETLPRIDIYNIEGEIVDEPKVTANMKVTQYVIGELPITNYDGFIGVEYRGSSSQYYYEKKNFGIETRDAEGEDLSVSLLGFPEEEDWVLHGPFGDKSLMRNALMFDMAAAFDRYSSRWQFVEVYVDEEYNGLYVLLEKIKRDDNRVNINKLKEDENSGEDVTGGYIIKLDKTNGEHEGDPGAYDLYTDNMSFISAHGSGINPNSIHHFIYHTPKSDDITDEQKAYIQQYVGDFEDALASDQFKDETAGYRNFIEVDSFVDYFLATEISGNVDGYRLSTYLYKDKNDKLTMGPLWDYNLAFGNADYCDGGSNTLWVYLSEERCEGGVFGVPFWWYRLLEDPYFADKVKARWSALRAGSLSDAAVTQRINTMQQQLDNTGAVQRNFQRWDILGAYVWPNEYVGQTHAEEVTYLSQWLTARLQWLDNEITNL